MKMVLPWTHKFDNMGVAFAGSAGIGKTTTMNALNEYLRYPVVGNTMRDYIKKNKIEDILKVTGRQLMKVQMDTLRIKKAAEEKLPQFITDRTVLDQACYALYHLGTDPELQRGLMDYANECTRHAVLVYDVIFMLPTGQFPLEEDGVRAVLPAYQTAMQLMIEQAVALGGNVFRVHQVQSLTVEDRVAECMNVIEDMLDIKAYNKAKETKGIVTTNESRMIH